MVFLQTLAAVTGCMCTDSFPALQPLRELSGHCLLAMLCDWETQLQDALHFLGHEEHTVGLQAAAPSYVRGLLRV